jgi:glutathione S-transferase
MADDDSATVRVRRVIKAPREAIFAAWTDPASMRHWLAPRSLTVASVKVDLRVGGAYSLVMRMENEDVPHHGVYREIAPPERLAFTWISGGTQQRETLVTIELHEHPDGTELVLTHERLPTADQVTRHTTGWTSIVEKLAARLSS